jgi:hypothetical protein
MEHHLLSQDIVRHGTATSPHHPAVTYPAPGALLTERDIHHVRQAVDPIPQEARPERG